MLPGVGHHLPGRPENAGQGFRVANGCVVSHVDISIMMACAGSDVATMKRKIERDLTSRWDPDIYPATENTYNPGGVNMSIDAYLNVGDMAIPGHLTSARGPIGFAPERQCAEPP